MAFTIRPGFQRTISIAFVKDDGTPGQVEGIPTWELSEPALAAIIPAPDGMSVVIRHSGAVGVSQLTNRADGDLGEGVHPVVTSVMATMQAPLGATAGTFVVGDEIPIVV